jgi:hypothetical protein
MRLTVRITSSDIANHVLISPAVQVLGAVMTAGTAVLASRQHQLSDIAAYSAGVGITALLGVLVGGGTALVYVTGDDQDRAAVRLLRWRLLGPLMAGLTVLSAAIYTRVAPELAILGVALGGATVVITNLAGLDAAALQRERKMSWWGAASLFGRLLPLIMVAFEGRYSIAMTCGSAATLILNIAARRRLSGTPKPVPEPFIRMVRRAYQPRFGLLALLDVILLRAPFIAGPLVAQSTVAGAFATLFSAQQSVTGLMTTGLFTIMTIRGADRGRESMGHHRGTENFLVLGALPAALAAMVLTPVALWLFGLQYVSGSASIWLWLMLDVPLVVANRACQYRLLNEGRTQDALRLLAIICVGVGVNVGIATLVHSIVWLAAAPGIGEAAGLIWLLRRGMVPFRLTDLRRAPRRKEES